MNGNNKGNMLISYLFRTADEIKNSDIEREMRSDLRNLAEKWKDKGFIGRYIISDDECISDKVKK